MTYLITEAKFLKDTAMHQMEIIKDDGIYRHIRFRNPGTSDMYFDLLTWPGHLCYTGDMGSFVFARIPDMFEFFRTKPENNQGLHINTGYWSEKVLAADRDGIEKFSEIVFEKEIKDYLDTVEANQELRDEVQEQILDVLDSDGEHAAMNAANEFEFGGFTFVDFWENDFKEYTHRFIWCCYALAWGIAFYDDSKKISEVPV